MHRKRIIRYFAIALVSIVVVVGIRAWIDFDKAVEKSVQAIFRCPVWFYSDITSRYIVRDPSSQSVEITLNIEVVNSLGIDVPIQYVSLVEAYASVGSSERYEGRHTRARVGAWEEMRYVVTFDLPRGGIWNLNVTYAFVSQNSENRDCEHTDTYEVNTES